MLRSHARNGNEFEKPCHRHSVANIEIPGFKILVNPKLVWNSWNLSCYHGAASTCHGKNFIPFEVGLGICFSQTIASHNKHDGFGTERPNFGAKRYPLPLIAFNFFLMSTKNNRSVVLFFVIFRGSFGHFNALSEFNAFMCIIQIWTTCTCSSAYKLVEK